MEKAKAKKEIEEIVAALDDRFMNTKQLLAYIWDEANRA